MTAGGDPVEALVTDVDLRNTLAGVRALGRVGVPLTAAASTRAAAGLRSRYATRRALLPSVTRARADFVRAVCELAREEAAGDHPLVVYPGREESIDALLDARLPRGSTLPWPVASTRRLRDKQALPALGATVGLEVPRTLAAGTARELLRERLPTPCLLKPTRPGRGGAVAVSDPAALARALRRWGANAGTLIAQEAIEGPMVAVAFVRGPEGPVAAGFQHRALRTWPANAGTVALAVSEPVDHGLEQRALALLAAAEHVGFAQLQFILGPGGPMLIDVNCGFPGSLPLALAAGANLPAAAHAVARGERPAERVGYRAGVSFRWLEADLGAALHGRPALLLRRVRRPSVGAVWAADDPLPSALITASAIGSRARRLPTLLGGRGSAI